MADVKKLSELGATLVADSSDYLYIIQSDGLGGYTQKKVQLSTVATLIVGDIGSILDAINGEVI